MDKLEAEISKAKKEAAELRRKAEEKELEIRTLMRAAKLRPAPPVVASEPEVGHEESTGNDESQTQRGGRQRGAISKQWRAVLAAIYDAGKNPLIDLDGVVLLAKAKGLDLQDSSALARMRTYVELGYVEEHDGRFRVTRDAVARFNLAEAALK